MTPTQRINRGRALILNAGGDDAQAKHAALLPLLTWADSKEEHDAYERI